LEAAGLTPPRVFITAEDIPKGKPDPSCYQLAASRLGWRAEDCLAFEDAPAGIRAGEAAGAAVIVVTATHQRPIDTPHAKIPDCRGLRALVDGDGRLRIEHDASSAKI
jgi:sugar-phosphatase